MIKNRQLRWELLLISAVVINCVMSIYISITISTLFSYTVHHVVHLQVSTPTVKSGVNKDTMLRAVEQSLRMGNAGVEGSVLGTGKISLHGGIKLPSFKVQTWYFSKFQDIQKIILTMIMILL